MRINESGIRRIIREELIREGVFDDMMGRVRGMFGGENNTAAARESRPLKLSDLIPLSPAIAATGFTRESIAHLQGGGFGGAMITRTYPAAFNFGLTPMRDGAQWSHPFLVRGALTDQPALERYIDPISRPTPDMTPRLKIPEESRHSSDRRLGNVTKFPKGTPSDAELKRLGVNMAMWSEYTRGLPPEKRDRRARDLGRALIIVKELETAFRVLDDVFRNKDALFRPEGE